MSNLDYTKRDFLVKIAKMYFLDELSQQEISDKVGLSRSNISKILKKCRDHKIVEIRVNDTSSLGVMFQKEIKQQFDIKNIIVIPTEKDIEKSSSVKQQPIYLNPYLRMEIKLVYPGGVPYTMP